MRYKNTIFTWTLRSAVVALLAFGLWACADAPISAVEDFDYQFEDFDEIPENEVELDTTTVEVDYTAPTEDTTYVQAQDDFITNVGAGADAGTVPEEVSAAAQAAEDALDEDTAAEVDQLEQESGADPDAFVDGLTDALDDTTSQVAQTATKVADAAAAQQQLAALLGLTGTGKTAYAPSDAPVALPMPLAAAGGPAAGDDGAVTPLGTEDCVGDARAKFDQSIAKFQANRAAQEATARATYQRSVTKAESVRQQSLAKAQNDLQSKKNRAKQTFKTFRSQIDRLEAAGADADLIKRLRKLNMVILLSNANKAVRLAKKAEALLDLAVEDAIQRATTRRDTELQGILQAFEQASATAQGALNRALARCHNQGRT